MKLKAGWEIRNGRWDTIMVGCNQLGALVVYDAAGPVVRLYGPSEVKGRAPEYLDVLDCTKDNWQTIAHSYFTKHKLQSPWE